MINNYIREPISSGEWVDEFSCSICKKNYIDFNSHVTFKEGIILFKKLL